MIDSLKRVTSTDKFFLSTLLKPGDLVVDLTCGKGQDTLFLANSVGETGKVFAFDIQSKAINATKELIEDNNLNNVILIKDNHLYFDQYLDSKEVTAFVLNLGYLPGEDKAVKTKASTTLEVLKKCLKFLKDGGIITICIYPHIEGKVEEKSIRNFVKTLTGVFNAYEFKRLNRNDPPYLIIITKDKS